MDKLHDILIVGAGGLATQCLGLIKEKYKNPAFFDEFSKEDEFYDYPLYHSEEIIRVCDKFIVLVAEPKKRKSLIQRFEKYKKHCDFIVSPDFSNTYNRRIDWRGVILEECLVEEGVKFASDILINKRCSIYHGTKIYDNVTLAPNVTILGNCEIGANTFIGAGSVIREGIKIGKNCILGLGSIVVNDIPDDQIWFGNPARFIKNNNSYGK